MLILNTLCNIKIQKMSNEENVRGKAKGGKIARIQGVIEAQICNISDGIERADNQRNARRAKRIK